MPVWTLATLEYTVLKLDKLYRVVGRWGNDIHCKGMKSKGVRPQDNFQLLIQNSKKIISDLDGTESSKYLVYGMRNVTKIGVIDVNDLEKAYSHSEECS